MVFSRMVFAADRIATGVSIAYVAQLAAKSCGTLLVCLFRAETDIVALANAACLLVSSILGRWLVGRSLLLMGKKG